MTVRQLVGLRFEATARSLSTISRVTASLSCVHEAEQSAGDAFGDALAELRVR